MNRGHAGLLASRLCHFKGEGSLWRRLILLVGGIGLLSGPSGCSEDFTRNVVATVLFVDGTALVSAEGGRGSVPLLSEPGAGEGEIIETSASSSAGLALLPNTLIRLDQNTRIEIVRISLAKDGNRMASAIRGRYVEIKLLSGRTVVSHDWGEAIARFTVATSQGELITSSNALFCMESDGHRTRVTCVSGIVGFRPSTGGGTAPIPPGHIGQWSPEASTVVAAETDAQGQADLEEALEVEQKLRALRERLRNIPPGDR